MRVQPSIDQRRVPDIFVFHVFFFGYEGDIAAIYDDVDGNDVGNDVGVSIQIPADAISGLYCWLYWEMTTIMMTWKMKKEMMTHCKFNIKSFVHAGEMTFRKRKLFLAHKVECNPRLKLNETFKRNSGKPSCLSPMCPDTWWGGRWPLRGRYLCHYLHHCRRHQSPPFITIEAEDQNQDNLDPHLFNHDPAINIIFPLPLILPPPSLSSIGNITVSIAGDPLSPAKDGVWCWNWRNWGLLPGDD